MAVRSVFREVFRALADFFYPPACVLCGGACPEALPLCTACMAEITGTAAAYEFPGRTIDDASRVMALLPYDRNCRAIVHAFKYHGLPSLANFAGGLMARTMLASLDGFREASLVPVPLHPEKLRSRGYNQSRRIAEGFAAASGQMIREDIIARMVYTGTQTALDAVARKENVRGVFQYVGGTPLNGMSVILIDDVMTTGSTLSECARALKSGGAGEIAVCVVATPDPGDD